MNRYLSTTLSVIVGLIFCLQTANAAPPRNLNFQGRLADATGTPVADGNYNIFFRLSYEPEASTFCHDPASAEAVLVTGGMVSHTIVPDAGCTFDAPYYLQIQVEGEATAMTPTIPLTAAAYAIRAEESNQARYVRQGATITGTLRTPGYASGNLAINGGGKNIGLEADLLDGKSASTISNDALDLISKEIRQVHASCGGGVLTISTSCTYSVNAYFESPYTTCGTAPSCDSCSAGTPTCTCVQTENSTCVRYRSTRTCTCSNPVWGYAK